MSWRESSKRFEYREVTVRIGEEDPVRALNTLGAQGWRVVTRLDGNPMYASFLVEREAEADPGSEYSQR